MARAYYGDRPYYEVVVFKESGKWYVRVAMKRYGAGVSRERAIKAALRFAREAERLGKTARVQEQTGPTDFKLHWPKPARADQSKRRS